MHDRALVELGESKKEDGLAWARNVVVEMAEAIMLDVSWYSPTYLG